MIPSVEALIKNYRSLARLIVVLDWLTTRRHHHWLSLRLHLLLDLAHHRVAHHVHHGVDSALELLGYLAGWHTLRLLRRHHHHLRWLQHVHVARVLNVVEKVTDLHLADALVFKEVLGLVEVEAHLLHLLEEALFLIHEVLGDHADALMADWAHGKLLLDKPALFFGPWVGCDVLLAHPVQKLRWHLHQSLLGQEVRVVLEVVERNELDDVSGHILAVSL